MTVKVGNAAELIFLTDLIANTLNGTKLKLFQNNHTPVDADVLSDYTECTFTGYAAITLNSWSAAFTNVGNKAETDETLRTFTAGTIGTSNNVYGYYVTDAAGTHLLFAELASGGPYAINTTGQTFSVQPKFTLNSE